MAVHVIDTIKPKNNGTFPVVEAADVKVTNDKRLDAALNDKANQSDLTALQTTVSGKASQADLTALSETVSGKASQADLNSLSESKADKTALAETNATVATKANSADLATTNAAVASKANASDVATETANLQAQIDNIVSGSTEDSEVINARVGTDGTSYQTLKARLDSENTELSTDMLNNIRDVQTEIEAKNGDNQYTSETIDTSAGGTTTGGVNGNVGSTINITTSASYKHKKISVLKDDYFEVTIPQLTSATYPYYIIATDINDVIVRRWAAVPSTAGTNSYTLYISDSSIKYLYVMFKSGETSQSIVRKRYISLQSQLNTANANHDDYKIEVSDKLGTVKSTTTVIDVTAAVTTTGGVNGTIGSTINVTSSTGYKHKKIEANEGEYYNITIPQTTSEFYPYYVLATDTNDIVLAQWAAAPAVAGVNSYSIHITDSNIKYIYVMFQAGETSQSVVKKVYIPIQQQIDSIVNPAEDALKETLLEDNMYTVIEHSQNTRCFNFAFITDTHANGFEHVNVRSTESVDLMKRVCNLGMLDCGVHGGDIISAYDADDSTYIKSFCKYIQEYANIDIPFFFAKGNHEVNAENGYVAGTAIEIPQYYIMAQNRNRKNVVTNPVAPYDGYYYVDFEDTKIRLIVANVYRRADNGVNMNMGTKEEAWMYTKALDFTDKTNPTAWNVIVVSHFHFTDTANFTKMLQAFNNKGTRYGDYIFDENNGGSIIAHIHGHSHVDEYSNEWGYNQIGVRRAFANEITWGTTNEICFDVFSVDLDNNMLYETRFGNGSNRTYTWGDDSGIIT